MGGILSRIASSFYNFSLAFTSFLSAFTVYGYGRVTFYLATFILVGIVKIGSSMIWLS